MYPRRLFLAAFIAVSTSSAYALVIDSFRAGPLQHGPESTNLALEQSGLPLGSAIGGARDWFAQFGGSLSVDTTIGSLRLNHDRGPFEVAILRYGHVLNSSPAAPLNADFTAEGHTQITFRMARTASGAPVGSKLPAYLRLSLRSGVGTANTVGASFAVRPFVSDEALVLQMPFSEFQGFAGPIDFSDVDGIDLSFFFEDFAELEITEIFTSAGLPGDYNLDGTVNAADYVVWRDNLGRPTLPNRDPSASGGVGIDEYHFWKAQFGRTFPMTAAARASAVAVPESATFLLVAMISACGFAGRRHRAVPISRFLIAA